MLIIAKRHAKIPTTEKLLSSSIFVKVIAKCRRTSPAQNFCLYKSLPVFCLTDLLLITKLRRMLLKMQTNYPINQRYGTKQKKNFSKTIALNSFITAFTKKKKTKDYYHFDRIMTDADETYRSHFNFL